MHVIVYLYFAKLFLLIALKNNVFIHSQLSLMIGLFFDEFASLAKNRDILRPERGYDETWDAGPNIWTVSTASGRLHRQCDLVHINCKFAVEYKST